MFNEAFGENVSSLIFTNYDYQFSNFLKNIAKSRRNIFTPIFTDSRETLKEILSGNGIPYLIYKPDLDYLDRISYYLNCSNLILSEQTFLFDLFKLNYLPYLFDSILIILFNRTKRLTERNSIFDFINKFLKRKGFYVKIIIITKSHQLIKELRDFKIFSNFILLYNIEKIVNLNSFTRFELHNKNREIQNIGFLKLKKNERILEMEKICKLLIEENLEKILNIIKVKYKKNIEKVKLPILCNKLETFKKLFYILLFDNKENISLKNELGNEENNSDKSKLLYIKMDLNYYIEIIFHIKRFLHLMEKHSNFTLFDEIYKLSISNQIYFKFNSKVSELKKNIIKLILQGNYFDKLDFLISFIKDYILISKIINIPRKDNKFEKDSKILIFCKNKNFNILKSKLIGYFRERKDNRNSNSNSLYEPFSYELKVFYEKLLEASSNNNDISIQKQHLYEKIFHYKNCKKVYDRIIDGDRECEDLKYNFKIGNVLLSKGLNQFSKVIETEITDLYENQNKLHIIFFDYNNEILHFLKYSFNEYLLKDFQFCKERVSVTFLYYESEYSIEDNLKRTKFQNDICSQVHKNVLLYKEKNIAKPKRENIAKKQYMNNSEIIIDKREFKSKLPCALFESEFNVIPKLIPIGDYVVKETFCVERKQFDDLVQSVLSGHLFLQLSRMVSSEYVNYLLIEGFVYKKKYYPFLKYVFNLSKIFSFKLFWSSKVENTVLFFDTLCKLPIKGKVLNSKFKGIKKFEESDQPKMKEDKRIHEFLRNESSTTDFFSLICGLDKYDVEKLKDQGNNLFSLSKMSKKKLIYFLGNDKGEKIFTFFNEEFENFL